MRTPAFPTPTPRAVPGVGSLLRQAAREAWTHPREPAALLVAAAFGHAASAATGVVVPLVGMGLATLSADKQDEIYLIGIPITAALLSVGVLTVLLTSNLGVVRAISQRLDGGPPIGLWQCVRLTWPRLLTVAAINLLLSISVYMGLAGAVVPGVLALAIGNTAALAVIVHGLGIGDAVVLAVTLFSEHPGWHLRAGGLWVALMVGPLVPAAVLWATGSSWGPPVFMIGSQFTTLIVVVYSHFWLLAYKALVGQGRAPIWPSRA